MFLGGEAGVGKTSLSYEFGRRHAGRARFLVGVCDVGSTPRTLGPLSDVADALGLQAQLDDPELPRASLFRQVRTALGRTPTVLVLEDLQWADEATLDLLRFLARRLDDVPVLIVATFRDDEVAGAHPLAALMGDLATATAVSRTHLAPLSLAAVTELSRGYGHDLDAEALHRSTDGNPFFVTEVLAAGFASLPTTVRDAVVARARRLSGAAWHVLETVAVFGTGAEISMVLETSGQSFGALDECVVGGVLLNAGTSVAFRHELARQAMLDVIPPAGRVQLHRQLLAQLVSSGSTDHQRLAVHAAGCGDAESVLVHAPRAARVASRLGSHRQAADFLRTALRHAELMDPATRADALEQLSYECHLTAQPVEALDLRRQAVALRVAAGDLRQVGVGQRWLSRLSWFLGRSAESQRYAVAAVVTLEPLGSSADLAMAYSNLSQLRMLGGSPEEALVWGRLARDAARTVGDREVEAHALNNMGTALLRRGDLVQGRARLDESLAMSLSDGLEEHAARAWSNIGALQASKRMLTDAAETLRAGIAHCDERDLDSWSLYLRSWLSGVLNEQGDTRTALDLAQAILRHPDLSVITRTPALLVLGSAGVRHGDPTGEASLADAHELARHTTEPLLLLPVALLQAEAAWTAGRTAEIVTVTEEVWRACSRTWEPWVIAELAWWRRLGGATDDVPFELPGPFALMRAGHAREASVAWSAIGRPFWSAMALASGGPAEASEAVANLLHLGATASAQAVRRDLALRGRPVPRGPRATARTNAAGLTARELEVLGYLVEGLSDAELAARLTLSERTVGHHVSAVLRKLRVPSRSRAAAAAAAILGTLQVVEPDGA